MSVILSLIFVNLFNLLKIITVPIQAIKIYLSVTSVVAMRKVGPAGTHFNIFKKVKIPESQAIGDKPALKFKNRERQ